MEEKLPIWLYITPDGWGSETFYLDEDQAEEAADDLTEIFGEECSIDDCTRLTFFQGVDEETAMYEGGRDGHGHLIRRKGDDFVRIEEFRSPDDYCYECKEEKSYCDCDWE